MRNPLTAKLAHGVDLTDADRAVLDDLIRRTRTVGPRQTIIHEGERPEFVFLVLDGFACRYKTLKDGSRQNMAYLVPGDFCDLHIALLGHMDHTIATLSPCTVVDIPRHAILDLTDRQPRIARALWWCTLVDEGTLREWLLNNGRREAGQRLAHLLCELLVRLRAVGLADENGYALPVTQDELADTLGITPVHTNRVVRALRDAGLVEFRSKRVTIPDVTRLHAHCEFDPSYLHLAKRENDADTGQRL